MFDAVAVVFARDRVAGQFAGPARRAAGTAASPRRGVSKPAFALRRLIEAAFSGGDSTREKHNV